MKWLLNDRQKLIALVLVILGILLLGRLLYLTVFEHKEWATYSNSMTTKTIYTVGARGNIYDRNGKLLAGSKQSYTVKINWENQTSEELNNTISYLIQLIKKQDDSIIMNLPIKMRGGSLYFSYDKSVSDWLAKNDFDTDLTASQAFKALRDKLDIDDSLDKYSAQLEIQNTYGVYPPISVDTMTFTYEDSKKAFLDSYFSDLDKEKRYALSAKEAFAKLREKFKIPEKYSDYQALRIMNVRYSLDTLGYSKYMSATVAKDVSEETVMLIEEKAASLPGVQIVAETKRYYPDGGLAAHVVGYLGSISDTQKEAYTALGYSGDELIGKSGIEKLYESTLKGTNGVTTIQVNSLGEKEDVLSQTAATKGKDVYLTIDAELQKAAETGLEKTIKAIRTGAKIKSKYGKSNTIEVAPNAKSGCAVAIEIATGEVLALANYPDFDPNLFVDGISAADWQSLQSKNPRDSLSPTPLYNMATMSAVQPGSTFKPVTATAALECGLNPNMTLEDPGYLKYGGKTFGCLVWNRNKKNHGTVNLVRAIGVSCNYYFYCVATGKNWKTGQSFNYDTKITQDMISDYAKQYGLGVATGIEIEEAIGSTPSSSRKKSNTKIALSNILSAEAETYFKQGIASDNEKLEKKIGVIVDLLDNKDLNWETLTAALSENGVKDSKNEKLATLILYTYYPESKWGVVDTFNLAIGQGDNAYTPLQMANYAATIGNKGVRNSVSVVSSVEGQGKKEKAESTKVEVSDDSFFNYLLAGMKYVGKNAASVSTFKDLPYAVACKTGTAEKQGKINTASEVDYIKKHLNDIAPYLSWSEVRAEMKRLMKQYPETYTSRDTAVRRAVINLSNGRVKSSDLDAYKDDYDSFAWVIAVAPANDPQIAVCAMIPQGASAGNAAPIVKEILGAYFENYSQASELDNETGVE